MQAKQRLTKGDAISRFSALQDHCRRERRINVFVEREDRKPATTLIFLFYLRREPQIVSAGMNKLSPTFGALRKLATPRRFLTANAFRFIDPRSDAIDEQLVRAQVAGHDPLAVGRSGGGFGSLTSQAA